MKVLIDIPKELLDNIDKPIKDEDLLRYIIKNGIVLDGLTNGEMMQKMLPYAKVEVEENWVFVDLPCERYELFRLNFPIDWWNRNWGE